MCPHYPKICERNFVQCVCTQYKRCSPSFAFFQLRDECFTLKHKMVYFSAIELLLGERLNDSKRGNVFLLSDDAAQLQCLLNRLDASFEPAPNVTLKVTEILTFLQFYLHSRCYWIYYISEVSLIFRKQPLPIDTAARVSKILNWHSNHDPPSWSSITLCVVPSTP